MDASTLLQLPDELLEAIVFHLPPAATLSFGSTCRRANKIASEHLVWRRHCLRGWRYWDTRHEIDELRQRPPAQVRWRQIFADRRHVDKEATETFEALITTQQHRIERIERISDAGYDVKDLLQRLRDSASEDAEDVLARKYFAGTILAQIYRRTALEKWGRLQKQQMVRLEEVLGAYDLFVLRNGRGDLQDIDEEFHRLADAIRAQDAEWEERTTRQRAVRIAQYLRDGILVGNPSENEYHALRNNFIGMALFVEPHSSLPLQSVAIYCAVARRLGVLAKPSNYPHHVHAVIEAPPDYTLDGKPRKPDPTTDGFDIETMHMDPWRSSEEVPRQQLKLRLRQMGAPQNHHGNYLGAASTMEIAIRTGHNIMNSVQEARDRWRANNSSGSLDPDTDAAWYSMLWSMMILGDGSSANATATSHRRRQCLPYLAEQFQAHFPRGPWPCRTSRRTLLSWRARGRVHGSSHHLAARSGPECESAYFAQYGG